jgi:hypothetical protein
MIRNITGASLNVISNPGTMPYINTNAPLAGQLRFWQGRTEVFDGNAWIQIDDGYANIELPADVQECIRWAKQKMKEELEIEKLAAEHPAVKIALTNLNKAKEQLAVTIHLSKDNDKTS